ncbi:fimbrial protein [Pantoea sp. SIMBA_072]
MPFLTGLFLLMLSLFTHAAENMTFHGTLVKAPDCHINNDQTIEVPFGNVGVDKVDGVNYARKIDYTVTCDGESDENLYLSVNGTGVDWDSAAVKASADNLAIEIRQAGSPFVLGSQVRAGLATLPDLMAVPVRKSGTKLATGNFTAAATLVAFYQ